MNIKLPATLTARVTKHEIDKSSYETIWVDITLFFGNSFLNTWRVFPKDIGYRDLNAMVEDDSNEDVEDFVAKKLQELWFPKEPS